MKALELAATAGQLVRFAGGGRLMPDEGGAGMGDQEQAERGASTVSNRGYWISQASLDDIAEREVQLRTDLERVTAELEQAQGEIHGWRQQHIETSAHLQQRVRDLRQVEAERDAMREVVKAAEGLREAKERRGWAAHLQEADAYQAFFKALARLDATRKATADATEEGK